MRMRVRVRMWGMRGVRGKFDALPRDRAGATKRSEPIAELDQRSWSERRRGRSVRSRRGRGRRGAVRRREIGRKLVGRGALAVTVDESLLIKTQLGGYGGMLSIGQRRRNRVDVSAGVRGDLWDPIRHVAVLWRHGAIRRGRRWTVATATGYDAGSLDGGRQRTRIAPLGRWSSLETGGRRCAHLSLSNVVTSNQ